MKLQCHFRNLLLAAAVITGSGCAAYGDSLVLIAQNGGQYDYGIELDANRGLTIVAGDKIALTGLFGVTGASVLPDLSFAYSTPVFTATSVTITDLTPFVLDPLTTSQIISAVRVISSVSTTATIGYQVQTGSEGTLSGSVAGPLAIVPEPAELPAAAAIAALLALKIKRRGAAVVG